MRGAIQTMLLLLLNLLQQGRLSKVVIIGAVLLFIAGVSLLVYFYRRYQRIEKEPEEEWDHSRSLFVNAPPSPKIEDAGKATVAAAEVESTQTATREFASPSHSQPPAASTIEPSPVEATAQPSEHVEAAKPEPASPVALSSEEQMTQVLASPAPIELEEKKGPEHEHAAFDDDVWADLQVEEHSPAQGGETSPTQAMTEQLSSARVDERSHREPFESPRIERMIHREPYESPSIEPLTPRDQDAATRDLRTAPPPKGPARDTIIFGTKPSERDTLPLAAEPVVAGSGRIADPSIVSTRAYRTSAGSVLGLPAEASQGPLILGAPVRPANETGIGSLTDYGKDLSPKSGRGGTITLLVVLALLAGAALVYVFVPSVHSRVNAAVARVRGVDSPVSTKPKAQIFPSYRPEVNKNMVTARGAIDNISDEPLETLEVEISLQRGADAPPDIRRIPVTPNPLAPGARGAFEFEYDGKRDTGFVGYKITRLFSNGTEIKFRTPNPK